MKEERVRKDEGEAIAAAGDDNHVGSLVTQVKGGGEGPTWKKSKSCKGFVYYSSNLKSDSRNSLCVGITRSLPQVPRYIVGESELEASKVGRSFTDFKYGCVGYSVYSDTKGQSKAMQDTQSELPVCIGIGVLLDKRVTTADSIPAPVHSREDNHRPPQPQTHKPAQNVGDESLKRFTRNAGVVATGVAKNLCKVGNHLKSSLDDIVRPYRRRPK